MRRRKLMKGWLLAMTLLAALVASAQQPADSLPAVDSVLRDSFIRAVPPALIDSVARNASVGALAPGASRFRTDTFFYKSHPYFSFQDPVRYRVTPYQWNGKEEVFYTLVVLLLLFALIRNGFFRYLQDLFRSFFRTTLNQRQIKEQLLQSPLPSLLLNIFFVLSAAFFLTLVCTFLGLGGEFGFWLLFLYAVVGLGAMYAVKFIGLKLLGWIFSLKEATDTYIFIVFTTNKIIGIALLPFIVVMAFASGQALEAALGLSLLVIGLLFAYRFYLSYVSIHRQIRIDFFHFLIYLLAFEIAPLLLINKVLLQFLA